MKPADHESRLQRALRSLDGLSVGDAFGERFFGEPTAALRRIATRETPSGTWTFTDDTAMALSIVDVLAERGEIDADLLAQYFARRYRLDPARGYGSTAHTILGRIAAGEHWSEVTRGVFDGAGSMGNGGAMRAAPIGAYFADEPARAAAAARRSAEVTHAHPEGQAGAIAVAAAAAWSARGSSDAPEVMFDLVLALTPAGTTRDGIATAAALPDSTTVEGAAQILGNGARVSAPDTVPFALWCVARHPDDFIEAMWTTVAALGDRDTTCAIVGSIVALHPRAELPVAWLAARESLGTMDRLNLDGGGRAWR